VVFGVHLSAQADLNGVINSKPLISCCKQGANTISISNPSQSFRNKIQHLPIINPVFLFLFPANKA
jgi:hypothetical protein